MIRTILLSKLQLPENVNLLKNSEKLNQIEIKSDDEVKFSCVVKAVPIAYSINWKRNVRKIRHQSFQSSPKISFYSSYSSVYLDWYL